MKLLVTGGTGFVGIPLLIELLKNKHEVTIVTRSERRFREEYGFPVKVIEADLVSDPLPKDQLSDIEGVIHLAGEGIADKRWSDERKQAILDSRIKSIENLKTAFQGSQSLKTFFSASAIGIYGDQGEKELFENSELSEEGFLAEVCHAWEKKADEMLEVVPDLRVIKGRIGIVLGHGSGALPEMEKPARMGVLGPIGSGAFYMSWIHLNDLVRSIVYCIENAVIKGAVNLTAPNPVTNKQLTNALNHKLNRMGFLPVPKFALSVLQGEMASELFQSHLVIPRVLLGAGFSFDFETVQEAMSDLYDGFEDSWRFESVQFIPQSKERAFEFFCEAKNLEKLTPPWLNFQVIGMSTEEIQKGTEIDYKLKLKGIPITWKTLIKDWEPPDLFIDCQMKGPYSRWEHLHSFETFSGGTLMRDIVAYNLPLGRLGDVFGLPLIKSDVSKIFGFRKKIIHEFFGNS